MPKQHRALFADLDEAEKPSHLQRYAHHLPCVEINSSFYRPHRRSTWERWASTVPESFRFAVKVPKAITHTAKLVNTGALLQEFLDQAQGLGPKLGPLLVQLPPSLAFEEGIAHEFLTTLRELHNGAVALEPRHATWFTPKVHQLLRSFQIARVAADPPKGSELATHPAGWPGLRYYRLHGSPRTYYSPYSQPWLEAFANTLREDAARLPDTETWVIFDNTALGHATEHAIWLQRQLGLSPST